MGSKSNNLPKTIHLWEVEGFVKLSDTARKEFEKLIKDYGVRKLARYLKIDRGTIDTIYRKRKKIHSVRHLIKISKGINYSLIKLEKEVTEYGRKQTNMYKMSFPFKLNVYHLRACSIHGDGSITNQASWYQQQKRVKYMEKLLNMIFKDNKIRARRKDNKISYVTIPSVLTYLICKSLGIKTLNTFTFFEKLSKLPLDYKFQFISQFILDEGHFKGTTLTVSQHKQEIRNGFLLVLDSLSIKHSNPKNNKQDITIYGVNFPILLKFLNKATKKYGELAGFWFKEEKFKRICKIANPDRSLRLIKNRI